jgi:2,4-dienoyl-CoA reductase-like NADH-dependent reductase (Old Yellow Enzyme family)
MSNFPRVSRYKSAAELRVACAELGVAIPVDDAPLTAESSPLNRPIHVGAFAVGNRWAIHPMEGWDATPDGTPTDHTLRRWRNFGLSGAKLIWGGEAVAVQHDGRANPNQLCFAAGNESGLAQLRERLVAAHVERFGTDAANDLLVGLQLTHSGRFSRPNDKKRIEPRVAYRHPILDPRVGITDDSAVLTDDELHRLIERYVAAAKIAHDTGYHFVDIKHCHGYLGHELLSAYDRPGEFGGSFENRTRFLRLICEGVRGACPGLILGVRLSAFDHLPHKPDNTKSEAGRLGPGIPEAFTDSGYPGFGLARDNPAIVDLEEPIRLLRLMREELGVAIVNITAGSPYYNPHLQRPAYFPPSDGYQPPEDPLLGCLRQIEIVRQLREAVPKLPLVGSAFTYFQDYLPHIGQALIREGWVDFIGLGRMALSYWDLPADIAEGKIVDHKRICRTFSDCTTAPRNGIISGCYPLDDYYKLAPEHDALKAAKKEMIARLKVIS